MIIEISHSLLILIIQILSQQFFFGGIIQLHKIRDQPASIISRTIELSKFKIPSFDLKEMKLDLIDCLILQGPFLHFIKKNRKMVGNKTFYSKLTDAVSGGKCFPQ